MAKGNIILGYLRGSIGDITFFRAKGQQLSRARNRAPANPRTEPQMAQRSRFANAVKFFRQVDSGFFKYAFENRKANESDYNAFIRNNIDNSGYIGYQANKLQDWPALGLWQLSKGTLREITAPFPQPISDVTSMYFDLGVNFTNIQDTISDFSSQLISGAPSIWRSGDIITVVIYRATNKSTLPTIDVEQSHNVYCGIIQLRLDVTDNRNMIDFTTLVGDVELCLGYNNDGFCVVPTESTHLDKFTSDYWGYAVVHSRSTDKGLRVSNSTLASRDFAIAINAMSDSGQYYQDVLADWGANQIALLQGLLATPPSAFRVEFIKDDNTGTFFTLGSDGIYRAPLSLMTSDLSYLNVRVYCPYYVPLSDISISPAAFNNFGIAEPLNSSDFSGVEEFYQVTGTGQIKDWEAGIYTITFGVYSIQLELTS